jgi:hypothetical protein
MYEGFTWECTFTNVPTTPPTSCPAGADNLWTDILGKGMGSQTTHNVQKKVTIPNYTAVSSLFGQMVAKDPGAANFVRFIRPGPNNYVQVDAVTSPIEHADGNFWYGADLPPSKTVTGRWFLQPSGAQNHIPRAIVLYPTYNDPANLYVNAFETFDAAEGEVFWNTAAGWTQSRHIVVPIAAPLVETTFHVELALVDNDRDNREVWVTVAAGDVSQTVKPAKPTEGNQLNILTFDLAGVDAGTSEIVIDVVSPHPVENGVTGDSATLVGMAAHYICEVPS